MPFLLSDFNASGSSLIFNAFVFLGVSINLSLVMQMHLGTITVTEVIMAGLLQTH